MFREEGAGDSKMLLDIAEKYENNQFAWIKGQYYSYHDICTEYELVKKKIVKLGMTEKTVVMSFDGSFLSLVTLLVLIDEQYIVALVKDDDPISDKKAALSACKYYLKFVDGNIFVSVIERETIPKLMADFKEKKHAGIIIFSSGTSGEPKGALHDAVRFLHPHEGNREKKRKLVLFLEIDHIGGLNTFFGAYYSGSTLLVPEKKNVFEVCELIEKEKADILPTTPSFLNMMYLCNAFDNHDLSSLKIISYGTEKMRHELLTKLSGKLPDVKFIQTYGLSELGIMKTASKEDGSLQMRIGGTGFEYKIVNDELLIKSDFAMEGYLNANSPFDSEGWYNTHDIVKQDQDGFLEIVGRNTDIVNVGGLKCNLLEVEEAVMDNFEKIEDCLAFSETHPVLGNILGIKIKSLVEVDEREFKKAFYSKCREILPRYMIPVKIILSDKALNSYRWKKERNINN